MLIRASPKFKTVLASLRLANRDLPPPWENMLRVFWIILKGSAPPDARWPCKKKNRHLCFGLLSLKGVSLPLKKLKKGGGIHWATGQRKRKGISQAQDVFLNDVERQSYWLLGLLGLPTHPPT